MEATENDATQKMQTLSECVNDAVKKGYKENFNVSGKKLVTEKETASFSPKHVAIRSFYRFEGYSDPQDNSILYLIETDNGKKGTLIDAYGVDANEEISNFIKLVEDIQKKTSD
jgi:hypothetical protein